MLLQNIKNYCLTAIAANDAALATMSRDDYPYFNWYNYSNRDYTVAYYRLAGMTPADLAHEGMCCGGDIATMVKDCIESFHSEQEVIA